MSQAVNPRALAIAEILVHYQKTEYPMERRMILEHVSEAWIESADDIALRRHALQLIERIDDQTTQLAAGRHLEMPGQVGELRHALSCLMVLDHEPQVRVLVRRMLDAAIIWAVGNDLGEDYLLLPILRHLPLARLRGIQVWIER